MNLVEKLIDISREIGFLEFDAENSHFKYGFASAAGVIRKMNTALAERGILMTAVDKITHVENAGKWAAVSCVLNFVDSESGETLTTCGVGSGADTSDKAVMKAATAAYKYAIAHAFTLAWGAEDPEEDSNTKAAEKASRPVKSETKAANGSETVDSLIAEISGSSDLPPLMKRIISFRKDVDSYNRLKEAYNARKEVLSNG